VMTGISLVPVVATPDATLPVPLEGLLDDETRCSIRWSDSTPAGDGGSEGGDALQALRETLVDPTVDERRSELLAALRRAGSGSSDVVDLHSFAGAAQSLFTGAPSVRLLGERHAAMEAS
jgi:hypothetical protein